MPQPAHLAADLTSGSLILVDRAANLRRVGGLIDRIDKAAAGKMDCGAGKSSS
jgi:type II secretory pathway component GspD/PulD (secretin)